MHKTTTDIRDQTANLTAFTGTYVDKHYLGKEGEGSKTSFGKAIPLDHSSLVEKSSRCASVYK